MSMTDRQQPITLTAEQIISLVGHGATQEQLDGVRRELHQRIDKLDDKIEAVEQRLEAKIDNVHQELREDIRRTNGKIDRLNWVIVGAALALIFKDYLFRFAGL
jgi:peptidoglycan hydrolase CwlO-like protein